MTSTITIGAASFTPALVLGYETESNAGNTIHTVVGSTGQPAVTLGAETMRAGTLEMYFATRALAWAARATLKTIGVFTLVSTDEPVIGMKFVRAGRMTIGLDPDTLKDWVVRVGYQEVP